MLKLKILVDLFMMLVDCGVLVRGILLCFIFCVFGFIVLFVSVDWMDLKGVVWDFLVFFCKLLWVID